MRLDAGAFRIGNTVQESLFDDGGTLLLRRGVLITDAVLVALKHAGVEFVSATPSVSDEEYEAQLPGNDRSPHGVRPYDAARVEELQQRFCDAVIAIEDLAATMVNGQLREVDAVEDVCDDYAQALCGDADEVIAATLVPQGPELEDDCEDANRRLSERCVKMGILAIATGVQLDLPVDELQALGTAGVVHDWSLYALPPFERYLSMEEVSQQKRFREHPRDTFELLSSVKGISGSVRSTVLQVHERMDGSGFPDGKAGSKIKRDARILAVVDQYLSLVSPLHPETLAIVPCDVVAYILNQMSKRRFDPSIVRAFLQSLNQFPIGSRLELNGNREAKVLRSNGKRYGKPIVQITESEEILDLSEDESTIVRPILRTDPPEYRLRTPYRRLLAGADLPVVVSKDCVE